MTAWTPRDSLDHHASSLAVVSPCVPDASRRGRRIRLNVAEIGERWVYLLSHPCWRLIGDRSMHGARTCSSVQQCLELQVGDVIADWRKNISHYSIRDFSLHVTSQSTHIDRRIALNVSYVERLTEHGYVIWYVPNVMGRVARRWY